MKSFWGVWLFFILAACSPLPAVVVTPTATAKNVPTATITDSSTPQISLSETPSPHQEIVLTPTPVKPTVKVLSPEIREVKLSDLGLSNTTRLILYYKSSDSLRIMSGQDAKPQKIPNIHSEANIWSGVEISPNQKWFIYPVFAEMRDNIAHYDFWISPIDGKEQKIAVSDVQAPTYARWVTDEQLELWYYPGGSTCPQRVLVVNPFTQEALISSEVPPSTSPQCFFELSTNPDRSKLIYLNESNGLWNIYDFKTKQNEIVFSWLSESDQFHLWPSDIYWSASGITIALPQQETVDFIVGLSASDASQTSVAWNKIFLPDGKKIYNETFSWRALDNGLVGFDLVQSDYNYMGDTNNSPPSNFLILDLEHFILYDYGLDRAKTGERQKVISSFIFSSVNNRFLAWTVYEPPDMRYASETVVLDRETGRIARIKGFEFFGWGEVTQP
ncbi:MAG: hypothetical protein L6461_00965 [Anaerolineae bacterium]|nr:hypothetical protein [Anaerolineae bacterium]